MMFNSKNGLKFQEGLKLYQIINYIFYSSVMNKRDPSGKNETAPKTSLKAVFEVTDGQTEP